MDSSVCVCVGRFLDSSGRFILLAVYKHPCREMWVGQFRIVVYTFISVWLHEFYDIEL